MRRSGNSIQLKLNLILIVFCVIALSPTRSSFGQDCNRNGIPDAQDINPADPDGNGEVSADCNGNLIPDECDISPSRLIVADSQDLFEVDRETGAATFLATVGFMVDGMTYDPTDDLLYVTDGSRLYTIDPTSYAVNQVATLSQTALASLAFNTSSGQLHGTTNSHFVHINKATGVVTNIGSSFNCCYKSLAYDRQFDVFYIIGEMFCNLRTVNPTTGARGPYLGNYLPCPGAMTYDPDRGDLLYCVDISSSARLVRVPINPDGPGKDIGIIGPLPINGMAIIPGACAEAPLGNCSLDCDGNSVPDECDIASCIDDSTECSDCDGDGVLDQCVAALSTTKASALIGDLFTSNIRSVAIDGEYIATYLDALLANQPDTLILHKITDAGLIELDRETLNSQNLLLNHSKLVAIDQGRLAVGRSDDRVLIYDIMNDALVLNTVIYSPDTALNGFGTSVALNGDRLIVGAPFGPGSAGRAFIYRQFPGGWALEATVNVGGASTRFGAAVAIANDIAVIGDPTFSFSRGAANFFRFIDGHWVLDHQIQGDNPRELGTSVAISNDTVAVGAPSLSIGSSFGEVRVWRFDRVTEDWALDTVVNNINPTSGDGFGVSVDMDRERMVVGTVVEAGENDGRPLVSVFRRVDSIWERTNSVFGFFFEGTFGSFVDIDGGRIASGSIIRLKALEVLTDEDENGIFDQCDINNGRLDVDNDLIPDDIDLDCDGDGIPDRDSLVGNDCNANGIPDTCDLDVSDPDGNGEISEDCNEDEIPDLCQFETWAEFDELFPASFSDVHSFGEPVEVEGEWAVFGRYRPNWGFSNPSPQPIVVVFHLVGGIWNEFQILEPEVVADDPYFGVSVDISDERIVIGSVGASGGSGSASVYEFNGTAWTLEQTLLPDQSGHVQSFGHCVAIHGDRIAVSAYADNQVPAGSGAVYLYQRIGGVWVEMQKLNPPTFPVAAQRFGYSIAMNADRLVVGSPINTNEYLSVFQLDSGNWELEQIIRAPFDGGYAFHGIQVEISERRIVAACQNANFGMGLVDAALIYVRRDGVWVFEDRIDDFGAPPGDEFGHGLALNGDLLAVGSPMGRNQMGIRTGAVGIYRFDNGQWNFQEWLNASPPVMGRRFGNGVAWNGNQLLVSSFGVEPAASNGGSVTVVGGMRDCDENGIADTCELASRDCNSNGILDECEPDYFNVEYFVDRLLRGVADYSIPCYFDLNIDGRLDGDDISIFVLRLVAM